jgi:hypothetical protein
MDEGAIGMNGRVKAKAVTERSIDPARRADVLEKEINETRENIGRIAGELDRRRHALFDFRRHALPLGIAALAVTALGGGAIAFGVFRRRRRATIRARLGRLWSAIGRASENPERVARPAPGAGRRIAAAGGAAAASVVGKELARFLIRAKVGERTA